MTRLILKLICLLTIAWLGSGCSRIDMRKNIPWGDTLFDVGDPPVKIICMWTNTVMQQGESEAKRGFGGRVMFYGKDNGKPVKVEGTLVVYAFDEEGRAATNATPDRKFVFTAEQFAAHYSKSKAGHSYSFWIPWDTAGGVQKDISLIARFTPIDDGGVVISEQSRVLLPGTKLPIATKVESFSSQPRVADSNVQQISFLDPAANNLTEPPKRLTTTTIELPNQFGRRAPTSTTGTAPTAAPLQAPGLLPAEASSSSSPMPRGEQFSAARASSVGSSAARGTHPHPTQYPHQRPLSRFGLERSRALGAPLAPLDRGLPQTSPSLSAPQSGPASPPPMASLPQNAANVLGSR